MAMKKRTKRIYADHAASTPADPRVVDAMAPYCSEVFGNAGSVHSEGRAAKEAVEEARTKIAREIGAHASEIVFTSGGTEASNLAILGCAEKEHAAGRPYAEMHFVTLAIEHASVLECFKELERRGARVTYVGVGSEGVVAPEAVANAIEERTVLVSAMFANSEIGTVQPIRKIGLLIKKWREERGGALPYFHTDACQALEYFACNVSTLVVDMMTIDAQKVYGPKGVGFLYKAQGVALAPIMHGGRQEGGLRPGTPPTALIVGLACALEIAAHGRVDEAKRLTALRDRFIAEIAEKIPGALLNGHARERLPNNANFSFPGKRAEYLVLQLDQHGIAAGTRSACHVGEEGGSHVVRALGRSEEETLAAVRFVFGRDTNSNDIENIIELLLTLVKK